MSWPTADACPGCGSAVRPMENYCEECGLGLSAEARNARAAEASAARAAPLPGSRDHIEIDLGSLAGVTDRGLWHESNEDAMALAAPRTPDGLAAVVVVCDGVSTSDRPGDASQVAADAAAWVLTKAVRDGAEMAAASLEAFGTAAEAVASLAGSSENAPSSTYVSAVVIGGAVTLCWVGDSRGYWLSADSSSASELLSRDDSWAEVMIASGALSRDEALALPQAHVITRWLGADAEDLAPNVARFRPRGHGALLLCSDGLWNYQPEPAGLARLAMPAAVTAPLAAASTLVSFALDAGGQDNITAVVVPVGAREASG